MNSIKITDYLKNKFNDNCYVVKSFIFGSVAKGSLSPNDCDLFVVTNQTPYQEKWLKFISDIEQLKINFEDEFSLKLNVTINTEGEFTEPSAFRERVLKRKIIEIN